MSAALQPEVLCLLMVVATFGALLAGFPVAFTLAGVSGAAALVGVISGAFDPGLAGALPQRIYAVMANEVLVAVPLFVFMGVMLERSRIAEDLLTAMGGLFGARPGGIAIAVTVVGMLMAASTGIVGATVVTMGMLSLPAMLRAGYSPAFASGSIAAAGTLGQIIPPSIVLVLLGDQLSAAYQSAQYERGIFAPETVSVNELFAGAIFPGLLLVGLYIVYQLAVTRLAPGRAPPGDPGIAAKPVERSRAVLALVAPLLLIIAVLGSILGGIASPTEAAGVGAVGATMLAGYRADPSGGRAILAGAYSMAGLLVLTALFDLRVQRSSVSATELVAFWGAVVLCAGLAWGVAVAMWRTGRAAAGDGGTVLVSVMRASLMITAMIFAILIGATMFSLVFRGLGGAGMVETFLTTLPGGTVGAVVTVMAVMFVLGFFLDFLEIVFIVVPIVAPVLLRMEIAPGVAMSPVWLGVMMGLNLQTSFLTPPFGVALFYLRGVAPESVRTLDIYRGVAPFVLIQLSALAVVWLVPGIATWLPGALYGG